MTRQRRHKKWQPGGHAEQPRSNGETTLRGWVGKKKWLAIARDRQLQGSHILLIEAEGIQAAYDECLLQCALHGFDLPERRAVYELHEGMVHVCSVLDERMKEGLFNGRVALSLDPKSDSARPGPGAVWSSR